MMSAMGIPDYDIAKVIGVSEPTMRKHFWQELEVGHIEANAKVASTLYRTATDPTHPKSVTAGIFWLKARAGWREDSAEQGKKQQTAEYAKTAEAGTDWAGLLQ